MRKLPDIETLSYTQPREVAPPREGWKSFEMWYPRLGGEQFPCVVEFATCPSKGDSGCFDVFVWSDLNPPTMDSGPNYSHHCDPMEFVEFGLMVLGVLAKHQSRSKSQPVFEECDVLRVERAFDEAVGSPRAVREDHRVADWSQRYADMNRGDDGVPHWFPWMLDRIRKGDHRGATSNLTPTLVDKALAALRLDDPWSLHSVLTRLCDAADHLLHHHGCDTLGHEGIALARDAGREIIQTLESGTTR